MAIIQLSSVMLLMRGLTIADFGLYAMLNAVNLFILHWINPGITNMIVQAVAQGNSIDFKKEIFVIIRYSIIILPLVLLLFGIALDNINLNVVILAFVSDVLFDRIIDLKLAYLQGKSDFKSILKYDVFRVSSKLIIVFILFHIKCLEISYIFSGFCFMNLLLVVIITIKLWYRSTDTIEIDRGIGRSFAASISFKTGYLNSDKFMLEHFMGLGAVGFYSGAQKVLQLVNLPLQAYMAVQYPIFFKLGRVGRKSAISHAKLISTYVIPAAGCASITIYLAADTLSLLLTDNLQLKSYIEIMSGMPIVLAANTLLGDLFTGLGQQKIRSKFQGIVFVFNIIMNLILLPKLGVFGAIIATYLAELLLILLYSLKLFKFD